MPQNSQERECKSKPNRLIKQKSPYLLQHACDPVGWFPWGDKAFEKASKEQKPVFLSIGYSTCHWCHVMEQESFEDEEVASYLNLHCIAVKVDREERPDLDQVYMKVCQVMTGQRGWPLTIILREAPLFCGHLPPKELQVRHAWPVGRAGSHRLGLAGEKCQYP